MEPTTPGSYLGQFQNGYYWNGTSWDRGETMPPSAVPPSTMSLNSGAPTAPALPPYQGVPGVGMGSPSPAPAAPAPAPAPVTPTPTPPTPPASPSTSAPAPSTSSRPSILSTIMRVESGGKNIPQQINDINMRNGDPAQGFYQITGGTWNEFGGDKTGHKSALDAPYATQLQIAQNIPVERWGPATQQALKAAGYEAKPGETLGQMLARYGEDPTGTRPEDVGGSSGGGTTTATAQSAPFVPPAGLATGGLLAQSSAGAQQAAAAGAAEDKKKADKNQELIKQGQGLLGQAETQAPQFQIPTPVVHRPQAQVVGMPDFQQILAQQRLMQGM